MSVTIWESTAGAAIASVGSGSHQWFNTSNGFTTDGTNVPAAAWMPVAVPPSEGHQHLIIQWRGKVVSVGGTQTCTALTGRMGVVGVCEESPHVSYLVQPAVTRATVTVAAAQALAGGIAVPVFQKTTTAGSQNTYSAVEFATFNAAIPDCWPLIPDSSNVAADDYTEGTLIVGNSPLHQIAANGVNAIPMSIRGLRKLYVAIKFIPTLGGTITDLVIAGKLAAYFS